MGRFYFALGQLSAKMPDHSLAGAHYYFVLWEQEKEHRQGETAECIDERREENDRRLDAPHNIDNVEDEGPCQEGRYQNRADECQQCRTFQCHRWIMKAGRWYATMLPVLGS